MAYADIILADSPVFYMPFDGNLQVQSSSTYGGTGTSSGTVTYETPGFQGSSYLNFSSGARVNTDATKAWTMLDLSMECWVRFPGADKTLTFMSLTSGTAVNNSHLRVMVISGRLTWMLTDGTTVANQVGPALDTNVWYHVVLTRDVDGPWVFYLNGASVASGTRGGYLSSSVFGYAGNDRHQTTSTYVGPVHVDEFAAYDTVLSASRVKAHYDSGMGIGAPLTFRGWGIPAV